MKTVQHYNDNRIYDRIMLGSIMVILGQWLFILLNETNNLKKAIQAMTPKATFYVISL